MRKLRWRRQIGQPVFPMAEYCDGFPVRSCVSYDGDEDVEIARARARWLVTLMCDGRPLSTRWVGDTRTASAWAVWYKLAASVEFAHVYDRKTRTSSRARVDFSRGTMKACISVGEDDNGAACVLRHYYMDGY